ncbi:MAG: hypothetical protein LBU27_02465 [Candidatus Peribacteria bacterium]|jgi:hypothetical protein|nr:hypothetical protein [Candidatus Peribacteria bacterium]
MKTEAGNIIEGGMKKVLRPAKDSFGRIEKVFAKIAQPPRGKFQYEKQLLKQMEEYSKLQGKMLQKTELLNSVKNLSRRFEKGRQLAGIVEYSDGAKLMLKNAEDAKDFFDNVRAIGRESP